MVSFMMWFIRNIWNNNEWIIKSLLLSLFSSYSFFYVIQITQSHIDIVYPQEISETEAFVMKISKHRSIADGMQ